MSSKLGRQKHCHGGLLIGRACTVQPESWRRVCEQCLAEHEVEVPDGRCRLLVQPVGSFSSGRTYYVQWTLGGCVIAGNVRPFTLAGGQAVLLIFASEEEATACDAAVPADALQRALPAMRRLRMCSTSKSFCPSSNFVPAPLMALTSCKIHQPPRRAIPSDAVNQTLRAVQDMLLPPTPPSSGAEAQLPLGEQAAAADAASKAFALLGTSGPSSGAAMPEAVGWRSLRPTAHTSAPSSTHSSAPSSAHSSAHSSNGSSRHSSPHREGEEGEPRMSGLKRTRAATRGGEAGASGAPVAAVAVLAVTAVAGAPAAVAAAPVAGAGKSLEEAILSLPSDTAPFSVALPSDGGDEGEIDELIHSFFGQAMPGTVADGGTRTSLPGGGAAAAARCPSPAAAQLDDVEVRGMLFAHGRTLKAGGSSAWTVVSDARIKELVGDFPLGVEQVMQLRPRLFRYNGLAGTKADGVLYVGLIAQEVPEELAPYCCVKVVVLVVVMLVVVVVLVVGVVLVLLTTYYLLRIAASRLRCCCDRPTRSQLRSSCSTTPASRCCVSTRCSSMSSGCGPSSVPSAPSPSSCATLEAWACRPSAQGSRGERRRSSKPFSPHSRRSKPSRAAGS